MQIDLDIRAYGRSSWSTRTALAGLFTAIAIFVYGITIGLEYRWVKVIDIQQQAGRDMWSRAVIVDTPDRPRVLRTSDPLLYLEKGGYACISKRKIISRRWLRYYVELPGYCRSIRRPDAAPLVALPRLH